MLSPNLLTDSDLQALVPSAFTDHAAPTMSDRYGFVSTASVVTALRGEGFVPVYAGRTASRKAALAPYSRHTLRFRHVDSVPVLNEGHPEIVLRNDHAGGGCFEILTGFFRLVCSNGLILQSGNFGSIRVRHNSRAVDGVVSAVYTTAARVPEIAARIDAMRATEITTGQALDLAERALALRYGDAPRPVDPYALIYARRADDLGSSLWSTFNVIQENLIRGTRPSAGWVAPPTAAGRRRTMRAVRSVNAELELNAGLWTLAESMIPA